MQLLDWVVKVGVCAYRIAKKRSQIPPTNLLVVPNALGTGATREARKKRRKKTTKKKTLQTLV